MTEINKIIDNFKKGVADGLLKGRENNPNNLDYYRQGYDFGISLYSSNDEKKMLCHYCGKDTTHILDTNNDGEDYYYCSHHLTQRSGDE